MTLRHRTDKQKAVEEADVELFGDRKPDLISVLDGKLESLEEESPAVSL